MLPPCIRTPGTARRTPSNIRLPDLVGGQRLRDHESCFCSGTRPAASASCRPGRVVSDRATGCRARRCAHTGSYWSNPMPTRLARIACDMYGEPPLLDRLDGAGRRPRSPRNRAAPTARASCSRGRSSGSTSIPAGAQGLAISVQEVRGNPGSRMPMSAPRPRPPPGARDVLGRCRRRLLVGGKVSTRIALRGRFGRRRRRSCRFLADGSTCCEPALGCTWPFPARHRWMSESTTRTPCGPCWRPDRSRAVSVRCLLPTGCGYREAARPGSRYVIAAAALRRARGRVLRRTEPAIAWPSLSCPLGIVEPT